MEKNSARDDARHVNNNGLLRSGITRRAVTFAMVSGERRRAGVRGVRVGLVVVFAIPSAVAGVARGGFRRPLSPPVYSDFLGRVPSASRVARRDHLLRDHLLLSSPDPPRPRPRLPGSVFGKRGIGITVGAVGFLHVSDVLVTFERGAVASLEIDDVLYTGQIFTLFAWLALNLSVSADAVSPSANAFPATPPTRTNPSREASPRRRTRKRRCASPALPDSRAALCPDPREP